MNSEWQSLQPQTQQELKNTMNAMQPPQSVEEIKAGLETTEKGGVRQSIRNCLTVFQRDPLLSGAIAYNILTDRKDIIKPIGFHRESTALNDTDMKYLLLYLEETYGLTNEKKIDNAIGIVANENKYHPIRDYLNTLVWDGTERIRFCLRHFLGADADDYTYEALKLFLLGAISRAFQPGCKFEIMLCLVGGQGAGKSTFFRLLAVRDEWFSDDLRKLDDDNVYRKQNAARDRNYGEYAEISKLLDKIRSVGMGGISADDDLAVEKLTKKLEGLESLQATMKAVNAYFRKHKTLDGCPELTPEQAEKLKADMAQSWHLDKSKPYPAYLLSNNNANIRRVRQRIEELSSRSEFAGWTFPGGEAKINEAENRLQLIFEEKPDANQRQELKSNGFKWAPSQGAWQRQLNQNAIRAAARIDFLRPEDGTSPYQLQPLVKRENKEMSR